MKPFVVLETLVGPSKGGRFWTSNANDGTPETATLNTHSSKGELWYKEIAFCDTESEAISHLNPIRFSDILVSMGLTDGVPLDENGDLHPDFIQG